MQELSRRLRASLATASLLLSSIAPRPSLAQATNSSAPAFALAGAAFNASRGRLVVVGAPSMSAPSAETWEWNGTWSRSSAVGPSPRDEPMLVYDPVRKHVLLFGGDRQRESALMDTWAFDGASWRQLADSGPPARASTLVYDVRRDRVVLFGGATNPSGVLHNDVWEWDGRRWERVVADSLATSPAPRALHGLAYDERRGRVVLMGGFHMVDGRPEMFDDTWEWDGAAWRRIDVAGPGARDHVAMVYSPERGGVVLHGGGQMSTGLVGDSWLYDGSSWRQLASSGPPRGRHRLAYDSKTGAVLLYGGRDPRQPTTELWSLRGAAWTRISPP